MVVLLAIYIQELTFLYYLTVTSIIALCYRNNSHTFSFLLQAPSLLIFMLSLLGKLKIFLQSTRGNCVVMHLKLVATNGITLKHLAFTSSEFLIFVISRIAAVVYLLFWGAIRWTLHLLSFFHILVRIDYLLASLCCFSCPILEFSCFLRTIIISYHNVHDWSSLLFVGSLLMLSLILVWFNKFSLLGLCKTVEEI